MYANDNSAKPYSSKIKDHIQNGYEFRLGEYIENGFKIFRKDPGNFIGYLVVGWVISSIISVFISLISGTEIGFTVANSSIFAFILNLLTLFPYLIWEFGINIVAGKIIKNERYSFGNFLDGFKKAMPLIAMYILAGIMICFGFVLLILPGIYLIVSYMFAPFFVYYYNMPAWEAMETSRKIIHQHWWSFIGFFMVISLVNILGALACLIGLIITIPATSIAIAVAFDDICGFPDGESGPETIIGEQTTEEY